jgi:uncharacterized protein (DUF924 family)
MVDSAAWEEVLEWWLGEARRSPEGANQKLDLWWGGSPEIDAEVRARFADLLAQAARGELDDWKETAAGTLALILLFDQVPRNAYRGTADAFRHDARALALACELIDSGSDAELNPVENVFALMPLEHAEDLAMQERCVAKIEALANACGPTWRETLEGFADFARRHRDVIARFRRFPHRNAALGRTSTAEELRYLEDGARFGQ